MAAHTLSEKRMHRKHRSCNPRTILSCDRGITQHTKTHLQILQAGILTAENRGVWQWQRYHPCYWLRQHLQTAWSKDPNFFRLSSGAAREEHRSSTMSGKVAFPSGSTFQSNQTEPATRSPGPKKTYLKGRWPRTNIGVDPNKSKGIDSGRNIDIDRDIA